MVPWCCGSGEFATWLSIRKDGLERIGVRSDRRWKAIDCDARMKSCKLGIRRLILYFQAHVSHSGG